MSHFYLLALIISLTGLAFLDWRHKLAVFYRPKPALLIIGVGLAFLVVLDVIGISLGIFAHNPEFTSGLNLVTPDLPLEEFLLLILIMYTTLILSRFHGLRLV